MSMFMCAVCHAEESHEELVEEVFHVDGQYVLVEGVPAVVCDRCGEQSFSRETSEEVRLMVHGEVKAGKSISVQVLVFAS